MGTNEGKSCKLSIMTNLKNCKISVVGLGYVGLPLALEFGKKYKTFGYDISSERIKQLNQGIDLTKEIESKDLNEVLNNNLFSVTNSVDCIKKSNVIVITVPTPTDENNVPSFKPLLSASKTVGENLNKGDIIIYESTVYPGATEEVCVPILEKYSGLKFNKDFFVGYSPERINPGDKKHTISNILKVTSGSNKSSSKFIDSLYSSIISAGTFLVSSIKVAEASKVIENTQRDINIAFVNELSKIFSRLNIDTFEVLEAAGTKWNFLNFKPGLVGGHCIGVDPYYLAHKSQELGYIPEMILSGRRINDSMGKFVVQEVVKLMIKKKININNANALVLGFTFKENCPDFRNTKVIDVINELNNYDIKTTVIDPQADINAVENEYGILINKKLKSNSKYDCLILAVGHKDFKNIKIKNIMKKNSVIYDVKGFFDKFKVDGRL